MMIVINAKGEISKSLDFYKKPNTTDGRIYALKVLMRYDQITFLKAVELLEDSK